MLSIVLEIPSNSVEPLLFIIDDKNLYEVVDSSWNHIADPALTVKLDLEILWLSTNFSRSWHIL